MENPKTAQISSTVKDPAGWVSDNEPMTEAQATYLRTLADQAKEPGLYAENLTKAEASKLIDMLSEKIRAGTPSG